jgi:hypothetical protein
MSVPAIYLRLSERDLAVLIAEPSRLATFDIAGPLADGRALDLGRGWDELGCLIEGGIKTPTTGPTVGENAIHVEDGRAAWSWVAPQRVRAIASQLGAYTRESFLDMYRVDDEETAQSSPGDQTGVWADRFERLYLKLDRLRTHYLEAGAKGEAMLVRIGKR